MKWIIDESARTLTREDCGQTTTVPLYSREGFEWVSRHWLRVGWDQKHTYTFSWLGRPIIQLPEDMIRMQEVLYHLRPEVIIETGVAHGGSLVYYASLCKLVGQGRVIGVDVEIRPQNRQALEAHLLYPLITLVEGSSIQPEIVARVRSLVKPGETVLVILDSCHTREHVRSELEAYAPLVTPGSYLVAQDGIMQDLTDVPRGQPEWGWNNPAAAAMEFLQSHPEFVQERPEWRFNESPLAESITYWPSAWLRRRGDPSAA